MAEGRVQVTSRSFLLVFFFRQAKYCRSSSKLCKESFLKRELSLFYTVWIMMPLTSDVNNIRYKSSRDDTCQTQTNKETIEGCKINEVNDFDVVQAEAKV